MLATSKTDLLKELKRRVEDKILEPTYQANNSPARKSIAT